MERLLILIICLLSLLGCSKDDSDSSKNPTCQAFVDADINGNPLFAECTMAEGGTVTDQVFMTEISPIQNFTWYRYQIYGVKDLHNNAESIYLIFDLDTPIMANTTYKSGLSPVANDMLLYFNNEDFAATMIAKNENIVIVINDITNGFVSGTISADFEIWNKPAVISGTFYLPLN